MLTYVVGLSRAPRMVRRRKPWVRCECVHDQAFSPEKTSLFGDIGQCGAPIRLWRTLAADFSLAAALGGGSALPRSRRSVFFAGQNVKPPGSNPHGCGSSSAARCPLGAPPAGAERAICGPTEAASHLASPRIRHGPFRRSRLRFSSSPPPFPFRTVRWRLGDT